MAGSVASTIPVKAKAKAQLETSDQYWIQGNSKHYGDTIMGVDVGRTGYHWVKAKHGKNGTIKIVGQGFTSHSHAARHHRSAHVQEIRKALVKEFIAGHK